MKRDENRFDFFHSLRHNNNIVTRTSNTIRIW